ncbi:MAG TPA: Clp protease N-terminal domain-containing protein, partial [Kiritimatiellia bacterium]
MQMDRLTIKSQEAVQAASRLAGEFRHGEVDVEHLVLALLDQEEGVVRPLVNRLGTSLDPFRQQLVDALKKRATVSGAAAERGASRALREVLDQAFELSAKMKDE